VKITTLGTGMPIQGGTFLKNLIASPQKFRNSGNAKNRLLNLDMIGIPNLTQFLLYKNLDNFLTKINENVFFAYESI